MNTPISPYDPPGVAPSVTSHFENVGAGLLVVVTVICATLTSMLWILKLDTASLLASVLPGPHMPDAFQHVNSASRAFMILLTISFGLLTGLTIRRQYSMFIPLAAGPTMCIVGWIMIENFDDPNWSDWIWITSIGMLVSCIVTFLLAAIAEPPKRKEESVR